MSVPRGKVSFGAHAFPFSGVEDASGDVYDLPVLPIRIRPQGGQWSTAFNAVLDTASTITVLPAELAKRIGVVGLGTQREAKGAGSHFPVRRAGADIAIIDAHLPSVTCWEIADFTVWVASPESALDFAVVGWDLLGVFELAINHRRQAIELRYPPR